MLVVGSCYPDEILITVSAILFSSMAFHMLFVDVVFRRRSPSVLYTYRPIHADLLTPDPRLKIEFSDELVSYSVRCGRCHTNTQPDMRHQLLVVR